MKKLLQYEWKQYLLLLLTAILLFVVFCTRLNSLDELPLYEGEDELVQNFCGIEIGLILQSSITSDLLCAFLIMAGGILLKHLAGCWIEKNENGRCFMAMLPVRRGHRCIFHIMMDTLFILFAAAVMISYAYFVHTHELRTSGVYAPWLLDAYIGGAVILVTVILFLLGFLYVMESLLVDGMLKVIGTFGFGCMIYVIIRRLYTLFSATAFGKMLFRFLTFGGLLDFSDPSTKEYSVFLKDKEIPLSAMYYTDTDIHNSVEQLSEYGSHAGWIICVLILGILLLVVSVYLTGYQELSASGLYFQKSRYVFAGIISFSFVLVGISRNMVIWQMLLLFGATAILFGVLVYYLNPEHTPKSIC